MEEPRLCIVCGADLAGPFQPKITLTRTPAIPELKEGELKVAVHAWMCTNCGLVHWYTEDEDLAELRADIEIDEAIEPRPGTSYERRTQMLRMLRRVRRM